VAVGGGDGNVRSQSWKSLDPMNFRWTRSLTTPGVVLAVLAGVALALAFPLPGWSGLAWVAPGCLFFSTLGLGPRRAFWTGYLGGLAHFLISLSWLLNMPFPAGAVAGWLALSAYCAIYFGLWSWWISQAVAVHDPMESVTPQGSPAWLLAARRWAALDWFTRAGFLALGATLWVGLEMIRGRLLTGFPWNFLGVTQWRNAPLIQVASVAGVYGVSFVVCWISLALASALSLVFLQPQKRFSWTAEARIPLIVLLIVIGIGFRRIFADSLREDRVPHLSLAMVQPSIRQEILWDPKEAPLRFEKLFQLTRQAVSTKPDVLVWPEASSDIDPTTDFPKIVSLVTNAPTWWIFGGDDVARDPNGRELGYNGAFLLNPKGRFVERYWKRRLVMFGEYVPLVRYLPFLKWLTPVGDGFASGQKPGVFQVKAADDGATGAAIDATISPVICFEDVFPHGVWDHVTPETDFLLELTNDGWFSHSGAQWQHCANAAFRSVENGVPLVRCANNGLTCWIDSFGRLRDVQGQLQNDVYGPGFLLASIPLAASGGTASPTFYHQYGDVFGWFTVAVTGLVGTRQGWREWSRRQRIR